MLRQAVPLTSPAQIAVRQARETTHLTQQAFADRIGAPVATLRDWEQGRFALSGPVLRLLNLIAKRPEPIAELAA